MCRFRQKLPIIRYLHILTDANHLRHFIVIVLRRYNRPVHLTLSPPLQGVVKRIIPAVASTNAVIAAACATEVFKLATSCAAPMNNYMVFNDEDGIYTYTYEHERNVSERARLLIADSLGFVGFVELRLPGNVM